MNWEKTPQEHKFTSTGIKFWRHQEAMESYRAGTGRSIISTHISPEGACNLKCPYCSVTHRDTHQRIALPVVKQYVEDLQSRGLKAVILTGGGEPTIYKHFNELVQWIKGRGLQVALITNGTQAQRVEAATWACFSWVRVSLNVFPGWEQKIRIPFHLLSPDCTVGCSMVYGRAHDHGLAKLRTASQVATANGAAYVRVLPDCMLPQEQLIEQHHELNAAFAEIGDTRFFHQHKLHAAPDCGTCHQSYFRPYLSEVVSTESGEPGTVFPCDSVVLNGQAMHFPQLYQLCPASKILDYMDRKRVAGFSPAEHCSGCVFTSNVEMLGAYAQTGEGKFSNAPLHDENFV
jgi:organic radical activating enzyme